MVRLSVVKSLTTLGALLLCFQVSLLQAHPLQLQQLAEGVYTLIGPMEQRNEQNLGNNANFGFIVSTEGVTLIDSGGSLPGAKAIEEQVGKITGQPIVRVINTGGQDHRWFGNAYFAEKGAVTLTAEDTYRDQLKRGQDQAQRMAGFVGKNWHEIEIQPAQENVSDPTAIKSGSFHFELIPVGPAHTGGEMMVWLPQQKILFTGDLVYMDRMLGVGPQSQHLAWIDAFQQIRALKPDIIVPGHGYPADLKKAERDTLSYLVFLREQVGALLDEGQDMSASALIDQSEFSDLDVYEQIHKRNAQRVFEEMEWE